jgi:hypothetical protein
MTAKLFTVNATGDLDAVLSEIGCQLFESGADTTEMEAGFAFAACDLVFMGHDDQAAAQAHMTKLFNLMREYMNTHFSKESQP